MEDQENKISELQVKTDLQTTAESQNENENLSNVLQQQTTQSTTPTKPQNTIQQQSSQDNQKAEQTATKQSLTKPPVSAMAKMYCGHFGKIFSNLAIFLAIVSVLCFVASVLPVFYYLIALVIAFCSIVFTLGLIFVKAPDFIPSLFSGGANLSQYIEIAFAALPYCIGASLAAAALSIVFLAVDKTQNHSTRIVISSVMLGATVLLAILLILGVAA